MNRTVTAAASSGPHGTALSGPASHTAGPVGASGASNASGSSGSSLPDVWEDLVTTALLGTDRRTPAGSASGANAPAALLDAAAVATLRRRAGLRPARAAEHPRPAPEDPRPELPPAAARRLTMLLTDRSGASGGGRGARPRTCWSCCPNGSRQRTPTVSRRPRRRCPPCSTPRGGVRIYGRRSCGSRDREACGWPASTRTGGSPCARRRAVARRCRDPGTRRESCGSGRRASSRSGSPCSPRCAPASPPPHANCSRRPGRRSGPRTG